MSSERWQQLYEIFDRVVELPPAERRLAVEEACGHDVELRRALESLIDADSAGDLLAGDLVG